MTKHDRHDPLTVRGAHLNMINSYQGGIKAVALMLGDETDVRLKNQAYELKGMAVPTERSLMIQEITGRKDFAQAIAAMSGGVFIELPDFELVGGDINEKFTDCIKTLGQMAATFQEIIADDIITAREFKQFKAVKQRLCAEAAAILLLTAELYSVKVDGDE